MKSTSMKTSWSHEGHRHMVVTGPMEKTSVGDIKMAILGALDELNHKRQPEYRHKHTMMWIRDGDRHGNDLDIGSEINPKSKVRMCFLETTSPGYCNNTCTIL